VHCHGTKSTCAAKNLAYIDECTAVNIPNVRRLNGWLVGWLVGILVVLDEEVHSGYFNTRDEHQHEIDPRFWHSHFFQALFILRYVVFQ
jgi:hypothetical protein